MPGLTTEDARTRGAVLGVRQDLEDTVLCNAVTPPCAVLSVQSDSRRPHDQCCHDQGLTRSGPDRPDQPDPRPVIRSLVFD